MSLSHFILNNLPNGLIGLLLAVIICAAMSSTAGEVSALATTTPWTTIKYSLVIEITMRNALFAP